jgi:hypothetical protein
MVSVGPSRHYYIYQIFVPLAQRKRIMGSYPWICVMSMSMSVWLKLHKLVALSFMDVFYAQGIMPLRSYVLSSFILSSESMLMFKKHACFAWNTANLLQRRTLSVALVPITGWHQGTVNCTGSVNVLLGYKRIKQKLYPLHILILLLPFHSFLFGAFGGWTFSKSSTDMILIHNFNHDMLHACL